MVQVLFDKHHNKVNIFSYASTINLITRNTSFTAAYLAECHKLKQLQQFQDCFEID